MCLFTGKNIEDIVQLGRESFGSMVLDSACSSTVCGSSWLNDYISILDDSDRKAVVKLPGERIFQFPLCIYNLDSESPFILTCLKA